MLLSLLFLLTIRDPLQTDNLTDQVGRREIRVYTAAYPLVAGGTVTDYQLPQRLERLGYKRVHQRPDKPGSYFWGNTHFWIYRKGHRVGGRDYGPQLFVLNLLRNDGTILSAADAEDKPIDIRVPGSLWLEPELLAESLDGNRAHRIEIDFDDLPERVWRPLLAAEDSRFFDHMGLDGKALARSLLANIKARGVVQGGSTITQQLIKNRDLTPKRSIGRKASEALRALKLEAQYDKADILETYLDHVYLGHVDGLAIHGYGTAARVFFSKTADKLSWAEACALAAMVQGPNRLSPIRNPEAVQKRRDWVVERLEALGWISADEAAKVRRTKVKVKPDTPQRGNARHFLGWVRDLYKQEEPRRTKKQLGMVVESGLDPILQEAAEDAVSGHLKQLRRRLRGSQDELLSAALVCLDGRTGEVLAYVGGDPENFADHFDRARLGRRQPGSAIKPLILLEAFSGHGKGKGLHAATRISDDPITIPLPAGPWQPENDDRGHHGTVTIREALRNSYNLPFVRIGRYSGYRDTAERLREAGLSIPNDPPPAFLLGAVEVSPLELAGAYTVFVTPGSRLKPLPIRRIEKPHGRKLERFRVKHQGVVSAGRAYVIADLLKDVVRNGSGKAATLASYQAAGKTGTSSSGKDAWFAGFASGVVTVVWVGMDKGEGAGLSGGGSAAPLWRRFMETAVKARPGYQPDRPASVVEAHVDPRTGLRVKTDKKGAVKEIFHRRDMPPQKRWWRNDKPEPIIK